MKSAMGHQNVVEILRNELAQMYGRVTKESACEILFRELSDWTAKWEETWDSWDDKVHEIITKFGLQPIPITPAFVQAMMKKAEPNLSQTYSETSPYTYVYDGNIALGKREFTLVVHISRYHRFRWAWKFWLVNNRSMRVYHMPPKYKQGRRQSCQYREKLPLLIADIAQTIGYAGF
jgi:hypothetical protein